MRRALSRTKSSLRRRRTCSASRTGEHRVGEPQAWNLAACRWATGGQQDPPRPAEIAQASLGLKPETRAETPDQPRPSEVAGRTQNPVPLGACGFDPHLRHTYGRTGCEPGDAAHRGRTDVGCGSGGECDTCGTPAAAGATSGHPPKVRRNRLTVRKRSALVAFALLIASLALVAAGCGGDDDGAEVGACPRPRARASSTRVTRTPTT